MGDQHTPGCNVAYPHDVPSGCLHIQVSRAPVEIKRDAINPDHYRQGGVECIDALRAALGDAGFEAFCRGNAIKYLWRAPRKNDMEDLQKAKWYLEMLLHVQNPDAHPDPRASRK